MFFALVAVPVALVEHQGGLDASLQTLSDRRPPALLDPLSDASGRPLSVFAVISLLGWGLGHFGQPHILARFMAIRHGEELPAARRIAVSWASVSLVAAVGVGSVGALCSPR